MKDSPSQSKPKEEATIDIDKLSPIKLYFQEEIKSLKTTYDQKLSLLSINKKSNEELQEKLTSSENARKELQQSIEETVKNYKENEENTKKIQNELLNQNKQLQEENTQLSSKNKELESNILQLNNKISDIGRETKSSGLLHKQNEISESMKKYSLLNESYNKEKSSILESHKAVEAQLQQEIEKAKQQNDTLKEQLQQEKDKTAAALIENEKLSQSVASLEDQCTKLKALVAVSDEKDNTIKQLTSSLENVIQENGESKKICEDLKKEYDMQISQLNKEKENIINQLQAKDKLISELQVKNNEVTNSYNTLELEVQNLKQAKCLAEELVCPSEDKNSQIDSLNATIKKYEESINNLKEVGQSYLAELESVKIKYFDCVSQLSILKNVAYEKDDEIFSLKDYILELRSHQEKYVPYKNDPIDLKLAEYINRDSNTISLKMLFIREKFGVYLFGKRRIVIKLEQEKLIVRVGGGFLSIDEFVEIYTPLEVEKLQRKLLGSELSSSFKGKHQQ